MSLSTSRLWILVGVVVVAIVSFAAWRIHERHVETRFMRMDPDQIPADPAMLAFAVKEAKPRYAERCAGCHGADLKGNHGHGAPDLTQGNWLYGSGMVSELERTITYGIRSSRPKSWSLADMPAFAEPVPYKRYAVPPLAPGQVRDVIEYLIALSGRPADAEAANRGRHVFAQEGGCYDCHSSDAKGDAAIGAPSLVGSSWLYGDGSREALYASITHGRQGICPGWVGQPDPVAIRALAVTIHNAPGAAAVKTAAATVDPLRSSMESGPAHD